MSPIDMGSIFAGIAVIKFTTRFISSVGSCVAYSLPPACVCSLEILRRRWL